MELAAVVVVALLAIAAVVVATTALSQQATEGWKTALESERQVRRLLTARVTTVENRLMSHSWAEFHDLQTVADETAKTAWAEKEARPSQTYGAVPEEMQEAHLASVGADLEPLEFGGPTVG